MVTWSFPPEIALWISFLAEPLHARVRARLLTICLGLVFAQGRRTVASWLRGAGVGREFRLYYYFLGSLGRKTQPLASRLLRLIQERVPLGERLLLALDDSPTKRFGPRVEGAGIHHNPTPGPAGQKFLYGHVWVTLGWLTRHPWWGTIALPLLAQLYVRAKDVPKIAPWYHWKFRTKLEQAAELVEWAVRWLNYLKTPIWVVADGAYAKRPFMKRALAAGVTIVSRLRKDAALCSVPRLPKAGRTRAGRPRKYGAAKISLAKRAGQKKGWQTEEFQLYGQCVKKTFKTFQATYRPVGGMIRVVLVKEEESWVAFFCTNPDASVAQILEAVADRAAIEQVFHDVKEVHGAGQQQVRNLWANIAVYHLNLWMHTLVELWAWGRSHAQLCDRKDSPWDNADRRPSHADRRNALRRECLRLEFLRLTIHKPVTRKIRQLFARLTKMVA